MSNLSSAKEAIAAKKKPSEIKLVGPSGGLWQAKVLKSSVKMNRTYRRSSIMKERDIKDLYFLDEMIKDMHKTGERLNGMWKWDTFLRDWYQELHEKVGHTNQERFNHLKKTFGASMMKDFLTIRERDAFLKHQL